MEKSDMEIIQSKIYVIRSTKVMLDSDLAELYGVDTKVLNQSIKRHIDRFPQDFMFQLTESEFEFLRSQIVTAKDLRKTRTLPYAFTQNGIAMLSSVLTSDQAIEVNIRIIIGHGWPLVCGTMEGDSRRSLC